MDNSTSAQNDIAPDHMRSDVLALSLEAACVGGWVLDLATQHVAWTPVTFDIHELSLGNPPSLEQAIAFYAPEARPVLQAAIDRATSNGEGWDLELPFVTARARPIWVRACGRPIYTAGRISHLAGAIQDVTDRHNLVAQAERLSVVVRQTTSGVIITDALGRAEWINDAFGRLTGFTLADLRGRAPGASLQGPDTDPATVQYMAACIRRGQGFAVEIVNYTRDRTPYWIEIACTAIRDTAGLVTGFIAFENDISGRKLAEAEARREAAERLRAEALLRDIMDTLPLAVSAYDQDEKLILTNRCLAETLPILAQFAIPGRKLEDVLRLATAAGQFPQAGPTPASRDAWSAGNLAIHRLANATRTLELAGGRFVQARERRSANGNLVSVRTDMTELKHAEAALRIQAEQDSLTKLANRAALMHALDAMLAPPPGQAAQCGALVLLDLDYFKQVNDTAGHDAGDALLIEIAARLRACTRGNDLPARFGGDEFAILLPGLVNEESVAARLSQIHAALSKPAHCIGHLLHIGISAGITLFPADGVRPERLMKNADLALYEAKRNGRARWCRYWPEQAAALEHHVHLADALRDAIAANQIQVALQPKRTRHGHHDGFEALARWHDGTRFVPPSEFIAMAEDTGQIVALGNEVIGLALARMRALTDLGLAPGRVAINVSALQVLDEHFLTDTLAALRHHGLGPESLEFELMESVLASRTFDRVEAILTSCHGLGIALALDDFGIGFASLLHVSRLPIRSMKIDRAVTAGVGQPGRGDIIARAMIRLAHSMDVEVTVVGIETVPQLAFFASENCDSLQGYLIAAPLATLDDAAAYLRAMPFVAEVFGEMTASLHNAG